MKTADVHLSRLEVETIGDNLSLNLRDRGGDISVISRYGDRVGQRPEAAGVSGVLVDGDLSSMWGMIFSGGAGQFFPEEIFGYFRIDLGALFWIDRVRILGDGAGIPPGGRTRERDRAFNYLWYRLRGSDGSLAPDGNSLLWTVIGELPPDQKNLGPASRFEERFELQKLRYFELLFPMSNQLAGSRTDASARRLNSRFSARGTRRRLPPFHRCILSGASRISLPSSGRQTSRQGLASRFARVRAICSMKRSFITTRMALW